MAAARERPLGGRTPGWRQPPAGFASATRQAAASARGRQAGHPGTPAVRNADPPRRARIPESASAAQGAAPGRTSPGAGPSRTAPARASRRPRGSPARSSAQAGPLARSACRGGSAAPRSGARRISDPEFPPEPERLPALRGAFRGPFARRFSGDPPDAPDRRRRGAALRRGPARDGAPPERARGARTPAQARSDLCASPRACALRRARRGRRRHRDARSLQRPLSVLARSRARGEGGRAAPQALERRAPERRSGQRAELHPRRAHEQSFSIWRPRSRRRTKSSPPRGSRTASRTARETIGAILSRGRWTPCCSRISSRRKARRTES